MPSDTYDSARSTVYAADTASWAPAAVPVPPVAVDDATAVAVVPVPAGSLDPPQPASMTPAPRRAVVATAAMRRMGILRRA